MVKTAQNKHGIFFYGNHSNNSLNFVAHSTISIINLRLPCGALIIHPPNNILIAPLVNGLFIFLQYHNT